MKYKGSCHCGKVRFELEGDLTEVMACNCSICVRKASLQWFVPWIQFALHAAIV
ncbi:MAG: GFA family protein, partial [Gammaproteobacteria bacterium]